MSPKEVIKQRLSIVDIVGEYVTLQQAGTSFKGLSPFSKEKSPSFFVSPDKGLFYCFSSGKGGDMFTFIQEIEGIDFKGALKMLAEKAGVVLEEYKGHTAEPRDRWFACMEQATRFFVDTLHKDTTATAYAKERGLADDTIRYFRIGYAPSSWDALTRTLRGLGYTDRELEEVGLIKMTEKGPIDKFRNRLMFPIMDSSGRVVAFSGRALPSDQSKGPKYLNSPETPLFKKSDVLFGLDKAKVAIRKWNFSILVEGQFDVVLLHQAGFSNAVAASGTALTDHEESREEGSNNLGLLKRLSRNIVLAYDSDSAGKKAAIRSTLLLQELDMEVKILSLPAGLDPADSILQEGKDAWNAYIRNAQPLIAYVVASVIADVGTDTMLLAKKIRTDVLPYIAVLPSKMLQSAALRYVHSKTGIKEEDLAQDLVESVQVNKVATHAVASDSLTGVKKKELPVDVFFVGCLWWLQDQSSPWYTLALNYIAEHQLDTWLAELVTEHEPSRDVLTLRVGFELEETGVATLQKIEHVLTQALTTKYKQDIARYAREVASATGADIVSIGEKHSQASRELAVLHTHGVRLSN